MDNTSVANGSNAKFIPGDLYPVLPQNTGRYNVAKKVKRSPTTLSAGMFTAANTPAPQYMPEHWSTYIHPEGQAYFVQEGTIRTVTDSYLLDSGLSEKIGYWVKYVEQIVLDRAMTISDTAELYLQLEGDDCNYYFVDHATRTVFYLDSCCSSSLGLLPVVSDSHLKFQLEEQYWIHVEYHSMHAIPFQTNIVEEIINQLIHGSGDHMTSENATFPYNYQRSRSFLEILLPARDRVLDGHIVTLVARLNNVIANNKHWTHHGQEQARLCRDSSILEADEDEVSPAIWPSMIASAISMKSSDFFVNRLNAIFTDKYVYGFDWQEFIAQSLGRWRSAFTQSLALLMLHIFCFFLPVSQPLAIASAAVLGLSLLISAALIHGHQDMTTSPSFGYNYLARNRSAKYKFLGLAFVMALPEALSLWGLILIASQTVVFVPPLHLYVLVSGVVLGSVLYGARNFLSIPRCLRFPLRLFTRAVPSPVESCAV